MWLAVCISQVSQAPAHDRSIGRGRTVFTQCAEVALLEYGKAQVQIILGRTAFQALCLPGQKKRHPGGGPHPSPGSEGPLTRGDTSWAGMVKMAIPSRPRTRGDTHQRQPWG